MSSYNTTILRGNPAESVAELKKQPGGDLIIFGSAVLVHGLMKANLIDEYRFLVHPVVMGEGKKFFKDGMPMARLTLVSSKAMEHGVTQLVYKPAG